MCLLTCFQPGVQPDIDQLTKGADHNPDGHGWALIAGDEILTDRGMDAASTIEQFRLAREEYPDGYAFFHSRIGTAGVRTVDNCHPFPTGPSRRSETPLTYVAHNGILPRSAQPGKGDTRSDTRLFAEKMLPEKFFHLDSPKTRVRLESWLGSFNKIVVLTVDPRYKKRFYLFNESQGTWKAGIWYSNQNHCSTFSYDWSSWEDYKRSGTGRKNWWEDAESPITLGSTQSGIWVSGGREGADATGKEVVRWEDKYFSHFICKSCMVLGRIRRDTGICDYCEFCDGCRNHWSDCECDAHHAILKAELAKAADAADSFRGSVDALVESFSEEEMTDALTPEFLEAYSDFLADQDAADQAERYGL